MAVCRSPLMHKTYLLKVMLNAKTRVLDSDVLRDISYRLRLGEKAFLINRFLKCRRFKIDSQRLQIIFSHINLSITQKPVLVFLHCS